MLLLPHSGSAVTEASLLVGHYPCPSVAIARWPPSDVAQSGGFVENQQPVSWVELVWSWLPRERIVRIRARG